MFHMGQLVDVRGHGRAEVIDVGAELAPGAQFHGRVRVRYIEDDTTFWANPAKLRPMKPAGKQVVVAFRTEEYRQAVVHNVDATHTCVEIGCHEGVTTRIIHNRCTWVVGIDIGSKVVAVARKRSPHLRFEVLDGMDLQGVLALSPTGTYDRVLIDISGQAGLHLAVPMVQLYRQALPHATIVIKNRALHRVVEAWEQQQCGPVGPGMSEHGQGCRQIQEAGQELPSEEAVRNDYVQQQGESSRQTASSEAKVGGGGGGGGGGGRQQAAAMEPTYKDQSAAQCVQSMQHELGPEGVQQAVSAGHRSSEGGSGDSSGNSDAESSGGSRGSGGPEQSVSGAVAAKGNGLSSSTPVTQEDADLVAALLGYCETFKHRAVSYYKTSARSKQREAERSTRVKERRRQRKQAAEVQQQQQQPQ